MWFTSCSALEVAFLYVCLLGFPCWGFISLPCPFSLGQAQCSISRPPTPLLSVCH
jgi:hypothetical protein